MDIHSPLDMDIYTSSVYSGLSLLSTGNYHTIVTWLYTDIKQKGEKKGNFSKSDLV